MPAGSRSATASVAFGNGVYRYKRTPLPEEVARVAALVAGVK